MKKGVVVSHGEANWKNIGDYIQTIAAQQFAGPDSLLLEREALFAYAGAPVRLLMNAWFMHHPERFPPAANISPLFVSFHLTPRVRDRFFTPAVITYLKAHEPIGCRDTETVESMTEHGIRAFYTSCLTLTLGRSYRHVERSSAPVFVDPWFRRLEPFGWFRFAFRFLSLLPYMATHLGVLCRLHRRCSGAFRTFRGAAHRSVRWLYTVEFHRAYSPLFANEVLLGAEYVTHKLWVRNCPGETDRIVLADALLKKYEQAPFVVTSRLHCALPCTGMGTPVWVPFHSGMASGRYGGNEEFLNLLPVDGRGIVTSPTSTGTADGRIHLDTRPPLRTEYRPFADRLTAAARAFMEGTDT